MEDMRIKKRELARRIDRIDNSIEKCHKANMHDLCMKWINKRDGMEEAFEVIFGERYIDYWIREICCEYEDG